MGAQGGRFEILGARLWDGREIPFGPLALGWEPLPDGILLYAPGTGAHQSVLLRDGRFTVHTRVEGKRTKPWDTWLAADLAWASARLGDP